MEEPATPLPDGLQVRNTFIHVESEQADDREVQSMPHGMFGHYLQKLPAFNGSEGTVQCFDQENGRYSILLATPAGGHRWAKVKPENVQVVPRLLQPPIKHLLSVF